MKRFIIGLTLGALLILAAPALAADHLYGITAAAPPHLVSFESDAPTAFTGDRAISGVTAGDAIVGMDVSPRDGGLYVLARSGAGAGRLYSLDPGTGALTAIATLAADPTDASAPYSSLAATAFGVDFIPQSNQLRIVARDSGDANLRVNVANGAVTTEANINPGPAGLVGIAFHNNDNDQATNTTQYAYDFNGNDWGSIGVPNSAGVFSKIADNTFVSEAANLVNLDEAPSGRMWATHTVGGVMNLYEVVNIATTGQHDLAGTIPADLVAMSAAHVNLFGVDATEITAGEAAGTARVTIVRLNPRGSATVNVAMTDVSAGPGDYTATSGPVVFGPGEGSRTLSIPLTGDTDDEPNETFEVTLSLPPGSDASLRLDTKTTVSIVDDDPAPVAVEPPPPAPPAPDRDSDGVADATDNCPNVSNAGQEDGDGDGLGSVCDPVEPGPGPLVGRCLNERQGTAGDDSLLGTPEGDVLTGFAGDDSLFGTSGDDCLAGGQGDDWVSGGDGADTLRGGAGSDVLLGGAGDDDLDGGVGLSILIRAGAGDDTVSATNGRREIVFCGPGEDTVRADRRDMLRGCEQRTR
jgi:hypothetical protein